MISSTGRYRSTGITVTFVPIAERIHDQPYPGWHATLDYYDDGLVNNDPETARVSTNGTLYTRYPVRDSKIRSGLSIAIDTLLADATRLGIDFTTALSPGSTTRATAKVPTIRRLRAGEISSPPKPTASAGHGPEPHPPQDGCPGRSKRPGTRASGQRGSRLALVTPEEAPRPPATPPDNSVRPAVCCPRVAFAVRELRTSAGSRPARQAARAPAVTSCRPPQPDLQPQSAVMTVVARQSATSRHRGLPPVARPPS